MAQILRCVKVLTRTPHNCFGCTSLFPPKTLMECSTETIGFTGIQNYYWCCECEYLRELAIVANTQDGSDFWINYGDIAEWKREPEYFGFTLEDLEKAKSA